MNKNRILLAFRNDEEIKEFSEYLKGIGYDAVSARDGARALEIAIAEVPSLIMAELDLPVIGGERMFQIIRHNPHTSRIPFLFIANNIADIKGFRTGIDIFLLRPLNLGELQARIRQTLSFKEGSSLTSKDIEGKLSHMSLADILQFLHLNKKEGELKVTSGNRTGSIYIKDGQLFNAVTEGVEKEKALFRLLEWNEGKFEFVPKTISITKKIKLTTGNLLMEGMRQIDEFKKQQEHFPDKKTILTAKIEASMLPKGIQPIIHEIMQLVRTYPKVSDLVEHCTHPDYEAYKTITSLIGRGVLQEDKKGDNTAMPDEFLTPDQAISIREKIISRYADMFNFSHGKICIISTSGSLAAKFISLCRKIPGFSVYGKTALSNIALENPLGEVASLKIYGGMELVLFPIPTVNNMGPLWKAFSTNLVGLILLWDKEGTADLQEMAEAKREILLKRRVPVVHGYFGEPSPAEESACKKALGLKADEPLFRINEQDRTVAFEVFYSLFGSLLRDDYVRA
ncbi:MAG: DUF4388 domain-containing protein [Deltaproteobacteria bacterium]|nr:DUF4388 domain-containing protein [Deltaproteobacteria bacterium]